MGKKSDDVSIDDLFNQARHGELAQQDEEEEDEEQDSA